MKQVAVLSVVLVFATLCLACGEHTVTPPASSAGLDYVIASASPSLAVVAGFPTSGAAAVSHGRYFLYDRRGRVLWHVNAAAAETLQTEDGAVVAWIDRLDADGTYGTVRMSRVWSDGRTEALGVWRRSYVVPLYADGAKLIFVVADASSTRVVVRSAHDETTLRLGLPGPVISSAVSGDGSRIALVTPGLGQSDYSLCWIRVAARRAELQGQPTLGPNSYVALDDGGRQVILGGSQPRLSSFGQTTGRHLPLFFVSQAQFGASDAFIMRFWTTNEAEHERALVLGRRANVRWCLSVSGNGCTIRADRSVRFVAYRQAFSQPWRLRDLRTGETTSLDSRYVDVAPLPDGAFVGVTADGRVTYANPHLKEP